MPRKYWSKDEKTAIVLEILRGEEKVAAICARYGVTATQAYQWRDQFLEAGKAGLKDRRTKHGRDPVLYENRRLKELLGHQALVIDTQKKLAGLLPTLQNAD